MIEKRSRHFLTTRWTLLDRVRERECGEALDELCRRYWGPVFQYLRRCGCGEEDAQDLTQDFFRDFVAREGFALAERERGRFRSFLLGCVRNHFANARKAAGRQKRGGGVVFAPLHEELDAATEATPEEVFDKRWAEDLVDRALERLRREWEDAGRPFVLLAPYLSGDRGAVPLAETAETLGVSLAATKSAVHRMRKRLGDLVKEEVVMTIGREEEAAGELDYLMQLLSR